MLKRSTCFALNFWNLNIIIKTMSSCVFWLLERMVRCKRNLKDEGNYNTLGSIEKRQHNTWQTRMGSSVGLSEFPLGQPQFMKLERKSLIDLSWLDGWTVGNNDSHQNNTAESWNGATWLCNDDEHSFTFHKQTNRNSKAYVIQLNHQNCWVMDG